MLHYTIMNGNGQYTIMMLREQRSAGRSRARAQREGPGPEARARAREGPPRRMGFDTRGPKRIRLSSEAFVLIDPVCWLSTTRSNFKFFFFHCRQLECFFLLHIYISYRQLEAKCPGGPAPGSSQRRVRAGHTRTQTRTQICMLTHTYTDGQTN